MPFRLFRPRRLPADFIERQRAARPVWAALEEQRVRQSERVLRRRAEAEMALARRLHAHAAGYLLNEPSVGQGRLVAEIGRRGMVRAGSRGQWFRVRPEPTTAPGGFPVAEENSSRRTVAWMGDPWPGSDGDPPTDGSSYQRMEIPVGAVGVDWAGGPPALHPEATDYDLAAIQAHLLLMEHLDEQQLRDFRAREAFNVISEHGNTYRIEYSDVYNVIRGGWRYCVAPADNEIPLGDQILAQKVLLETDEDLFLQTANVREGDCPF